MRAPSVGTAAHRIAAGGSVSAAATHEGGNAADAYQGVGAQMLAQLDDLANNRPARDDVQVLVPHCN